MMDAHNGDCVHVDFSCLFDRGLTLERPELVPFRLTQNMLDGFGPAGPDGAFKRCCEITLQARPSLFEAQGWFAAGLWPALSSAAAGSLDGRDCRAQHGHGLIQPQGRHRHAKRTVALQCDP